jgi:predicted amidohydrolase
MRELTIAVAQIASKLGSIEDNIIRMSEMISKISSQQRVDLIVFPELVTTGSELGLQFTELAQRIPGATSNIIAQRAGEHGVYVAFGMVSKERVESVLYNSAVLVGPDGELVDVYNKIHLHGEERMAFREGFKVPTIETELATFGLVIGYDLAFPEITRCLALEGAEIICVLGSWEAAHMDEWKTYMRARAYENAVFMAGANRIGEDVTLTFGGESMVVGPRGQIYASLAAETDPKTGKPQEGFAIARVDLDEVRRAREEFQLMQNRQPTVYKAVVRRY